jgi:hypothetical protein
MLSIHEDLTRGLEVKTSSNRNFGFVFTVFFAVVGILPWFGENNEIFGWAIITSGVFLTFSVVKPDFLSPLNKIWTKFGLLLQKIVNPVVLGAMFFLLLAPFGLAMRLMGKDLLSLKLEKGIASYWIRRSPPGPSPESMKNQY